MSTALNAAWNALLPTLGHTLWQAALAALLLWFLLRRYPSAKADQRYTLSLLTLGGVVLAWLITWSLLAYSATPEKSTGSTTPMQQTAASSDATPMVDAQRRSMEFDAAKQKRALVPNSWQQPLARAWVLGVCLMLCRTLFLLHGAGRLRRGARVAADARANEMITELRAQLGVQRPVSLLFADHLNSPLVVGVFWPAILLPAFVLTGLPQEQLRAVLAHELAHIRRHDYLINLIQLALEALLFFNPSVWWISAQIRAEREACCDALALRTGTAPVAYAQLLASFVSGPSCSGALALGPASKGRLLGRIRRILIPESRPALRLPWYSLLGALLLGVIGLSGLGGGTFVTVVAFARAMSAEERIQQMSAIEAASAPVEYPDEMYSLRGRVIWESKHPMPKELHVKINSMYRTQEGITFAAFGGKVIDGKIEMGCQVHAGQCHAYLQSSSPRVIWSFLEPFELTSATTPELVFRVQDREPLVLRLQDDKGQAVHDANVTWGYRLNYGDGWGYAGPMSAVSNAEGRVDCRVCWDGPLEINIERDGFQKHRELLEGPQAGESHTIVLQQSQATTISVRDAATTTGIAGAKLYLLRASGRVEAGFGNLEENDSQVLGTSGADGTIHLNTLADATQYDGWVFAPGFERKILQFQAGDSKDLLLGPPITVSGTLDLVPPATGPERLEYNIFVKWGQGITNAFGSVDVNVVDGKGSFKLENMWAGDLQLYAKNASLNMKLSKSVEGLLLASAENPTPSLLSQREVIVRLIAPPDSPLPEGGIVLNAHGDFRPSVREELEVHRGEVRHTVPVPSQVSVQYDHLAGYWFEPTEAVNVVAGEGPQVVEVPVRPAGMIHGEATGPMPQAAFASVLVIEQSPDTATPHVDAHDRILDGRFAVAPLPLGGHYQLLATSGKAVAMSPVLKLSQAEPIQHTTLNFVEGLPVTGRVLLPDGRPAAGMQLDLLYELPRRTNGFSPQFTDSAGGFRFDGLTPNSPGQYVLEFTPEADFQPVRRLIEPGDSVDIQLEQGLVIEGEVLEADTGAPLAEVEVYTIGGPPMNSPAPAMRTDAEGRFRFTTLSDAKYTLGVRGSGKSAQIEAVAGRSGPVKIMVVNQNK